MYIVNEHYITSCVHSIHHFLYIIIARVCLHFKLYSILYHIMYLYNLDEVINILLNTSDF